MGWDGMRDGLVTACLVASLFERPPNHPYSRISRIPFSHHLVLIGSVMKSCTFGLELGDPSFIPLLVILSPNIPSNAKVQKSVDQW